MALHLEYANQTLSIEPPAGISVDTFAARTVAIPVDKAGFLHEFETAGGAEAIAVETPLFVVNDGFRPTPTAQILSWLDDEYPGLMDRSMFLIATGTHPAPTPEHYERIFGPLYPRLRSRVRYHDARDMDSMVSIGTDRFSVDVYLNRYVVTCASTLVIGSVEPHYFAGYTGGRKALFPGLTDLATIERNHNLANSSDAQPLRLKGNPVADHMDELMDLTPGSNVFGIQLVADARGTIGMAACGPLETSFAAAVRTAGKLYAQKVSTPYDVVVCEMRPPLDVNLYQAQKALENCHLAVKDGGAIVVVSACRDGIGSKYFIRQAQAWDREENVPHDGVLRFGSHKLSRVNAMTKRIDVCLLSGLPDDTVRQVFYQPVHDINDFLLSLKEKNDIMTVALAFDAGHTVLTI